MYTGAGCTRHAPSYSPVSHPHSHEQALIKTGMSAMGRSPDRTNAQKVSRVEKPWHILWYRSQCCITMGLGGMQPEILLLHGHSQVAWLLLAPPQYGCFKLVEHSCRSLTRIRFVELADYKCFFRKTAKQTESPSIICMRSSRSISASGRVRTLPWMY